MVTETGGGARYTLPMRRTMLLLLLTSLLLAEVPARRRTGFDAISETRLRADLTFLASESMEGRMSLQRGSAAAVDWLVSEYAKIGLKPANGDSYLQPMTIIEYKMESSEAKLVVEHVGKKKEFRMGQGITGSFPNDVSLNAPIVFAGYGITAKELGYDDYAGLDARGKIVLVFDHEPQESDARSRFNGVGNTIYANSRIKILNAQAHGALAVLLMREPNSTHPTNQQRVARIPANPNRLRRLLPEALEDNETKIPILNVSEELTKELEPGANAFSAAQSAIDADLKPHRIELGTTAHLRLAVAQRRRATAYNLVGLIEGSDPALKAETIIYSAHYDHDGTGSGDTYPGADDNGSGTVGVVELARAFMANPEKPKRSLLFIVYAAEERGLIGSYYYAAHPLRPLATTRAIINFDMIGRNETPSRQTDGLIDIAADTSNEVNLIGGIYSPDFRKTVERENEWVGLRLNDKWDRDAALNVFQRSDQFPFAVKGIPAFWWFTGFHPDYHQTTDTVEKINFAKMRKILRLAYLTGWDFGDGETPKFIANPMPVGSR
ncbi:MAG: M28 family peptidase [Bryobacteraceae bacterium]